MNQRRGVDIVHCQHNGGHGGGREHEREEYVHLLPSSALFQDSLTGQASVYYYCAQQRATPYILNALCGHINRSLAISLSHDSLVISYLQSHHTTFVYAGECSSCGGVDVATLTSRERRSPDFEAHSPSAGMGTRICTHFCACA